MLTIIVTTLLISLIINIILKKLGLPTIIGYIFTGTIIAYGFGLHDAVHNHELKEIAEFGVVFLMFTIGLEFSIEHLKKMRFEVFIAGSMQILISAAIFYSIAHYILALDQQISFIISLALALSSTAIVLKTFNDTGEINRRFGQRSLGILIMQDIAVIPILLIIDFMSSQSDSSIGYVVFEMLLSACVLLLILFLFAKYLLEPFFTQIIQTNSDELFVGTILFLAISASYLAHQFGFSYSLGAFIAGMLIAETKYKHQAEADLIPFRDILLGIFFITVGMQIDFEIIFSYIHIIAAVLIAAIVLKFIIIYFIMRINENKKTSIKTALSLVQIGEFSLALLELARSNSLIGPPYGQIMILVIVISMILTPLILKNLSSITQFLSRKEIEDDEDISIETSTIDNHTIIIGFGEFGQNVAKRLKEENFPYIAIENNINTFYKMSLENQPIIFGNALKKNILKHANLNNADKIIVAIDNPKKLLQVCITLLEYVPLDKIIVKVHGNADAKDLQELGIKYVIIENNISSEKVCDVIFNT